MGQMIEGIGGRRRGSGGRRGGGGRALGDVAGEGVDVFEGGAADLVTGDFEAELAFDAGDEQENVQGIQVVVGAEEGHVVSDLNVTQLQVAADDVLELLARGGECGVVLHGW